jgi:restriction endonuclease S subunit
LEGLEISEILYSKVDHIKFRLDAEYYRKHFLEIDEKIKSIGETNLINIGAKLDCSAFYPSITEYYDFEGNGVPFLRVNEIKDGLVKLTESTAFLPQSVLDNNPSTIAIAYPGDLIIAKGGNTLAKVGLITDHYTKYALSRDIILVRTNKLKEYNRFFLWLFLHSAYGQALLWRTASQTGQPHLTLPSINEINLPKFDLKFEEIAERLYESSVLINEKSKVTYSQAENLLLETLGLADFQPSHEPINVKKFSESFGSSGRLDAEYYQVKYEDYESLVWRYKGGYEAFEIACSLKDKNFNPEDKTEYKYIELSNIGKSGEITDCTMGLGEELPSRARRKVATNDVVISSIEGSLDSCALVTPEYNNALCSTGFYVVNSKKLNPETLLVLFKSKPMQALLKKGCSGTILTAISKTELSKIPIPLIDTDTQQSLKEKINESFKLKKQSEHLLEVAKSAVEIAIEQDEATAMEYIKRETE